MGVELRGNVYLQTRPPTIIRSYLTTGVQPITTPNGRSCEATATDFAFLDVNSFDQLTSRQLDRLGRIFEIILKLFQCFVSHGTTTAGYMLNNLKPWNNFKIMSAFSNMLENIHELQ